MFEALVKQSTWMLCKTLNWEKCTIYVRHWRDDVYNISKTFTSLQPVDDLQQKLSTTSKLLNYSIYECLHGWCTNITHD